MARKADATVANYVSNRIKVPLGCFWRKKKTTVISVKYQICRKFIFILINKRESRADRDILDFFFPLLPYGVWINYLRFGGQVW